MFLRIVHEWLGETSTDGERAYPHELVPTAEELGHWFEAADDLDREVRRRLAARGQSAD